MFIARIILGLWGIVVLCGAVEAAFEFVSGGRAPTPISYHSWNQKLFHATPAKVSEAPSRETRRSH